MTTQVSQEERDPETLQLYTEESLEGLQQVEEILLAAERGEAPKEYLSTLFRTVHTMKGTAGYLAYTRTQELSHKAEDLLSKLRDGKIIADKPHFSCLIEVADRLKKLVENVKANCEEGDVEVAVLIARLQSLSTDDVSATAEASTQGAHILPASLPKDLGKSVSEHVQSPARGASQELKSSEATQVSMPVDGQDGTVRVNVAVLDRLMDLIGELVLARNQMVQRVKTTNDGNVSTQSVFQRLNVVTSDLQEQVMKTRMQPVARVFEKIPRIVRDVCRVTGKEVNTVIEGNATEIDKALVEAIRDPVMHIVRNAIDHGIEAPSERAVCNKSRVGAVYVRAAHKGGAVTIEVEDDGKGMDPVVLKAHAIKKGVITHAEASRMNDRDALDLVFRPGFSTAAQVSDISGRGVGMDVVRTHVERAGGKAEIESTVGKGTIIRLKMPLTMAIIPALLVRARSQRFAIPQANLLELVYLTEEQRQQSIEVIRGAAIHKLRGQFIPIVDLSDTLGLHEGESITQPSDVNIVILSSGTRRYSLIVDAIENTEEIVLKPLRGQLKRIPCYSGATVLGDGGVALILDVAGMAAKSGIDLSKELKSDLTVKKIAASSTEAMMFFTIASGIQCAVPLSMVSRLEQVKCSDIENLGSQEVLQYRNEIVPVIRPEVTLNIAKSALQRDQQMLIVFDFGHRVAMAVEEVIDVADIARNYQASQGGMAAVFGNVVAFGRTTLILDIYSIVKNYLEEVSSDAPTSGTGLKIISLLPVAAMRSSLESSARSAGLESTSCSSFDQIFSEISSATSGRFFHIVCDNPVTLTKWMSAKGVALSARSDIKVTRWLDGHSGQNENSVDTSTQIRTFTVTEREALFRYIREIGAGSISIQQQGAVSHE